MSMLKNPFARKDSSHLRKLDNPEDLKVGDIIKFGFLPQPDLSNQRFEVVSIGTYDFEHENSTQFTLKGENGNSIFLVAEEEDGEEYLAVSKNISRRVVKQLFDEDEFAAVFDDGAGVDIERKEEPEEIKGWTAPFYVCDVAGKSGYFHEGDYRGKDLPDEEEDSPSLDYYLLCDEEDEFAIEIEVYDDGETEVCVTVYFELSEIDEMWPSSKNEE